MIEFAPAFVLIAFVHLTAYADGGCGSLLTPQQLQTLQAAKAAGHSYEIFKREVAGHTKFVALVGEPVHQEALSQPTGPALYRHFDRTAFSFRQKLDIQDKLLGRVASLALKAVLKIYAFSNPSERADIEADLPHLDGFFKDQKRIVEVDSAGKPLINESDLVNNPFYEVRDDVVFERPRLDLPNFLAAARVRGESLRTVNLEHGFRPNWRDRVRGNLFTINVATVVILAGSSAFLPIENTTPAAVAYIGAYTWQMAGVSLHGLNARPWYRFVFPFVYVGDRRRNAVAAPNVLSALESDDVKNLVVLVEQRRLPDLRARLTAQGFSSVEASASL